MLKVFRRLPVAAKAARQLGARQAFWYAVYQLGLRSGHYRRVTPPTGLEKLSLSIRSPFHSPSRETLRALLGEHAAEAIAEADEIVSGQVRLFGGPPVPLNLVPKDASQHWTTYEGRPAIWGVDDIKFIWEPARFGWAYSLGRAYRLTNDERYPTAFWDLFETFLQANPPNLGPNWSSAQEVALRLIVFLFAASVFADSPYTTPDRLQTLAGAIAAHARRIGPTLPYARAQNNNHQISEALGLYAAGHALPQHPDAARWRKTGWDELNHALCAQIQPDGVYAQHSLNYHRLMLHAALQATLFGAPFPEGTQARLSAATTWLLAQLDPITGSTPNLGNNDGALILPLAPGRYADYRPVAQAAARVFLGQPALPPGAWDELSLWLGQEESDAQPLEPLPSSPAIHRLGSSESWATLRALHFTSRPAHADQLHVDLWWRGENIARDAGTFRYTAPSPWDNPLAETAFHNTVTVNNQSQMRRAGRFLWLDWAQAHHLDTIHSSSEVIAAEHNGYAHLGILHQRTLKRAAPDRWQVTDQLLPASNLLADPHSAPVFTFRIHWLLPDWPWIIEDTTLTLSRPDGGQVRVSITPVLPDHPLAQVEEISLVRAGEALLGTAASNPASGWFSPTYNLKCPALAFSIAVQSLAPFSFISEFFLENNLEA